MDNIDKKTQNNGFDDLPDMETKTESSSIDVNKYIHAVDEKQIGLDIFKESSKRSVSNNTQRPIAQASLPDSVRKKVISEKEKKIRRTKNSGRRNIIVAIIVFALITGIGLGTVFAVVGNKNSRIDVNFRYSTDNKEIGTVKNVIKRESNYAYGVYYPFFGKDTIDNAIKKQNDEIINSFLTKYRRYNSPEKGKGAIMFSDYSSTDIVDYYQIVRKTEYRLPDGSTSEHINTLFYDVKNDKILKGSDFFGSTFKQIVSVKIENYLKDNTKMSSEEIDSITNYKKIKLDNYSFDAEYLYLYVDDTNGSTVTVKLPLDSTITGHFKISYKTLSEYYDLAHKQVEETTSEVVDETTLSYY